MGGAGAELCREPLLRPAEQGHPDRARRDEDDPDPLVSGCAPVQSLLIAS